jgi:plasmid stability protein
MATATIAVTVRKIRVETHNALKRRAAENGRSTESEIRAILDEAVMPKERIKVGTWLHERAMEYGGFDLEIERDQTPAGTVSFE